MWQCRYQLKNGNWQSWMIFEDFQEALENCQFHGQGRPFEIVQYNTDRFEQALTHLRESIKLIEKSKGAFKSKLIALAREEAEKVREILEEVI